MGRNLFICVWLLVFLYFVGPGLDETRTMLQDFLANRRETIIAGGLPGALILVFLSLIFSRVRFLSIFYLLVRFIFDLLQLVLLALALAALVASLAFEANLWLEVSWLVASLYAWLYGAALSLWLFDFNYPLRNVLLAYSVLPMLCLALSWAWRLVF